MIHTYVGGYRIFRIVLKALFFFFRFAFSLENIYKELSTDIDGFVNPGHGDLSRRTKQGVLLLNAVLTVRDSQSNSHLLMRLCPG